MKPFGDQSVRVHRDAEGVIRVGERPAGLSAQAVALSGALLVVNVEKLDEIPHVRVADYDRASWWLPFVLGQGIADAVGELDRLGAQGEQTADADAGDLAGPLLRLAVGMWLYRWWPLPDSATSVPILSDSDERALECELGAIAWFVDEVFGGTAVAGGLLEPNVEFVDEQARAAIDGQPTERVLALTRAVLDSVQLDQGVATRMENLETLLESRLEAKASGVAEAKASATRRIVEWVRNAVSPPAGEAAFGWVTMGAAPSGATEVAEGKATIEWGRVPPRTLSSAEDNVSWSLQGRILTVRVAVHPDSRELDDVYFAAVFGPSDLIPAVVVELTDLEESEDQERFLVGSIETPVGVEMGDSRVIVTTENYCSPARVGNAVAGTSEGRAEVARIVGALVEGDSELMYQHDWAAFHVEPTAPWFKWEA